MLTTKLAILNKETGDLTETYFTEQKKRHNKEKDWYASKMDASKQLGQLKLGGGEFRVLHTLIGLCNWNNKVYISRARLGREVGITRKTCYLALQRLLSYGIIMNDDDNKDVWYIDPQYCWRGKTDTWQKARDLYRQGLSKQFAGPLF